MKKNTIKIVSFFDGDKLLARFETEFPDSDYILHQLYLADKHMEIEEYVWAEMVENGNVTKYTLEKK